MKLITSLLLYMAASTVAVASSNYTEQEISGFLGSSVTEIKLNHCLYFVGNLREVCIYAENQFRVRTKDLSIHFSQGNGIWTKLSLPRQQLASNLDFRYGYLNLTLGGDVTILEDGKVFSDLYYPYAAEFDLSLSGEGGGIVRRHNINALGHDLDTGLDITADVDLTAFIAFVFNPRLFEKSDGSKVMILEPKSRVFLADSDINDLNIRTASNTWFSWLSNTAQALLGAVSEITLAATEVLLDIATGIRKEGEYYHMSFSGLEPVTDAVIQGLTNVVAVPFILEDSPLPNSDVVLSKIVSPIARGFGNRYLDEYTDRPLYDVEEGINRQLSDALGTDENGLVYIHIPNIEESFRQRETALLPLY